MAQETQNQKIDPFLRIKYLGYCLLQLPKKNATYGDLVKYAKFFLAVKTKKLMKDPIWDSYTSEELLTEFYAHRFIENKIALTEFEDQLNGGKSEESDEFNEWADKQMAQESKKREQLEERITFEPTTMGD